jgi:cytochrome P450
MNEELRLVPPIVTIPKCTLPNSSQSLTIDGKDVMIPPETFVGLQTVGVHRNPKFWPHGKPNSPHSRCNTDLDEFIPERWLVKTENAQDNSPNGSQHSFCEISADGLGIDSSADTASGLFKPVRGAYIPFSEGARACLGRRFAQIEILAALAVIFTKYSVELAVDDWASAEQISQMDEKSKKQVWEKAKKEAERKMRDEMGTIVTIQLRGKPVRVRICERGSELFCWQDQQMSGISGE